jgi:hypothetical protein
VAKKESAEKARLQLQRSETRKQNPVSLFLVLQQG